MAAERKRREEEGKELTRGLDELEASLGFRVGAVLDDGFAGFEIESDGDEGVVV